jgi:hypothetical protein
MQLQKLIAFVIAERENAGQPGALAERVISLLTPLT